MIFLRYVFAVALLHYLGSVVSLKISNNTKCPCHMLGTYESDCNILIIRNKVLIQNSNYVFIVYQD